MSGSAPDYILKMMNKVTDQKSGKVGAAWVNPDRSITLVVDYPFEVRDAKDIVYTLFPNDKKDFKP